MKMSAKVASLSAIVIAQAPVWGTTIVGENLNLVRTGSTNNTTIWMSSSIGHSNYSHYYGHTYGASNFARYYSIVSGWNNQAQNSSAAFGRSNFVNDTDPWPDAGAPTPPRTSFATGEGNMVFGESSFAAGEEIDITADYASALGHWLINTNDTSMVVGKFNEDKANLLFSVGNGTGNSNRSNAFEVYADGSLGGNLSLNGSPILTGGDLDAHIASYLSTSSYLSTDSYGNINSTRAINLGENNQVGDTEEWVWGVIPTLVVGNSNTAAFDLGAEWMGASGSGVFGNDNTVYSWNSLVSGENNYGSEYAMNILIAGQDNSVHEDLSFMLGKGLKSYAQEVVMLGRNNLTDGSSNSSATDPEGPLLVVGNGTSDTERSDALIIKKNGDVIIPKAQGDIEMGVFGQ